MFFFFDNEKSFNVSYMAFETYVIDILKKYVSNQGKKMVISNENDSFDAYLPDGIDDIDEPLNVETKYFDTSTKSVYFQSLAKFATEIDKVEDGSILIILGADFTEKSIDSMLNMISSPKCIIL